MFRRNDFRLRLFLSADMIGSTAFKQNARGESGPMAWRFTVLEFLTEVPVQLHEACRDLGTPNLPEVYKGIGDEIVFVVTLERSYREAALYIAAFQQMLQYFMSDDELPSVKGSAWLCSFPVSNMELDVERSITVREDGQKKEVLVNVLEYIGPQMDVGFRVAKYSTAMKLPLTLDLALLLITAKLEEYSAATGMRFCYDGREALKGVLGERPYPLVSILIEGSYELTELRLLGELPRESASVEDLTDLATLCRNFIKNNEPQMFLPYLFDCDTFNRMPAAHKQLLIE